MTLYELNDNYKSLLLAFEEVEEGTEEYKALLDTLESIEDAFDVKVQNTASMVMKWKYEAEMLKAEKQRLEQMQKVLENKASRLEEYLLKELQAHGIEKTTTYGVHKLTITPSQAVEVTSVSDLPFEYVRYKLEPDKNKLTKALKKGEEIQGATLKDTVSLKVAVNKKAVS